MVAFAPRWSLASAGAYPGVAADDNGFGEQRVARGGVFGVVLGGQHTMGCDEGTLLDGDAAEGEEWHKSQ